MNVNIIKNSSILEIESFFFIGLKDSDPWWCDSDEQRHYKCLSNLPESLLPLKLCQDRRAKEEEEEAEQ